MASIIDNRGYNQGFELTESTRIRMQRRTRWILNAMDSDKYNNVLEIGCGTGEVSYWMAKESSNNILGTDLCVPFIEEANKKYQLPNLAYEVLDFSKAKEFNGKEFDYIIGNGILHHLYFHLDEALLNMKTLLHPGGKIIFIEPNLYNPYIALVFKIPVLRKKAHLEPDE